MPRPQGLNKTGGRKKGTPNKATQNFREALQGMNVDLPTQICELLPQLHQEKRVDVLLRLLPYAYPHLRPSDQTSNTDNPNSFVEFIRQLEADVENESDLAQMEQKDSLSDKNDED